jgi:hypothetical protein
MFLSSGLPDPNKSVFVRHSSTVVCTAGIPNSLAVEPRDEFNNLCIFRPDENPTEGYNVAITQVTVYQKFILRCLSVLCLMVNMNTSWQNFVVGYFIALSVTQIM